MNKNMETHVKVLGWLYIVLGALGVLGGVILGFILLGSGLISGDETAITVLLIVAIIAGGFIFLISVPGIIAGLGLLAYQGWARILAIILGILNLPGFPTGTILGAYTLYVMLDDETSALFASQ